MNSDGWRDSWGVRERRKKCSVLARILVNFRGFGPLQANPPARLVSCRFAALLLPRKLAAQ
jgi:hypothetical protein